MLRQSNARYALFLAALLAGPAQAATTYTWPGAAPCAGTLQACIDAASDGDRVEIATAGPIAENITMHSRSLTIAAAYGYSPLFANSGILADSTGGSADMQVGISGLRFSHGFVNVNYFGTGTATVDLRELVFDDAPGVSSGGLQVIAYGGTVNAMVYDNRVTGLPQSLNSGLIGLGARGGTLNASAFYNHVRSTSGVGVSGGGIFVDVAGSGSAGTVKLHANEALGSFYRGGIYLSEGLFSSTPVNYSVRLYNNVVAGSGDGTGIGLTPNFGSIDAQLVNNTVTRVNYGVLYSHWESGTGTVTGLLKNNLVRATTAVYAAVGNAINADYNLFNGPTPNLVSGAHTITAEAGLIGDATPRLSASSPAIDAADTSTLGLGLIINGLPVTDADGLRRIKGATNKADIGAYEYGDATFLHTATAANISGHVTTLDTPYLNGYAAAKAIITPNFNAGIPSGSGTAYAHPPGIYYDGTQYWRIFGEDFAAMPNGAHFDVFSPAPGSGSFVHVSDAGSVSGAATQLPTSATGTSPDTIVLATQNWSAGGHAQYNAHSIGVRFVGGAWQVLNLDSAPMPVNLGFNVYSQMPSPNAFRVSTATSTTFLDLDHPLLNGITCARPHVTRVAGAAATDYAFDLYYTSTGVWRIFGYSTMLAGTTFNVVVDPAQVAACTDVIFANGFD